MFLFQMTGQFWILKWNFLKSLCEANINVCFKPSFIHCQSYRIERSEKYQIFTENFFPVFAS